MPFMAIALLYGNTGHKTVYDLESLFNVLLVISTHLLVFGDPDKNHGLQWDNRATRVSEWFEVESFRTLADLKAGQFMSIKSLLFCDITPPFKILVPHLTALSRILFPLRLADIRTLERWQSTATCQEFIEVLDAALLDPAIVTDARHRQYMVAPAPRSDSNNRRKRSAPKVSDINERPMTRSRSSVQSSSACSGQSGGSIRC